MDETTFEGEIPDGEVHDVKPRILLGTLGAFLGALLGAALWVVIWQFGYVAAIAGIAIIFCAYKGYTLFSKSRGKTAAVISTIVSVIVLLIAHYACWSITIYQELIVEYDITYWEVVKLVPEFAFDPTMAFDFFLDLVIGLILIASGFYYYVRGDLKKSRKIPQTSNEETPSL